MQTRAPGAATPSATRKEPGKSLNNFVIAYWNQNMNRYKLSTPRAALGMIAVMMTATTMGALIVLPAKLESVSADAYPLTAAKIETVSTAEGAVRPACVDAPRLASPEQFDRHDGATRGSREFLETRRQSSSRSRANS